MSSQREKLLREHVAETAGVIRAAGRTIRVVRVTPDNHYSPKDLLREHAVACLDLDSLGPKATLSWVNEAEEVASRGDAMGVPNVIVIGSLSKLREEDADRLEASLNEAGAAVFDLPEGRSFESRYEEVLGRINSIYERFSRADADAFQPPRAHPPDEERRARWKARAEKGPRPGLSEYLNTGRRLSDEEFKALAERADTPDHDPDYED